MPDQPEMHSLRSLPPVSFFSRHKSMGTTALPWPKHSEDKHYFTCCPAISRAIRVGWAHETIIPWAVKPGLSGPGYKAPLTGRLQANGPRGPSIQHNAVRHDRSRHGW